MSHKDTSSGSLTKIMRPFPPYVTVRDRQTAQVDDHWATKRPSGENIRGLTEVAEAIALSDAKAFVLGEGDRTLARFDQPPYKSLSRFDHSAEQHDYFNDFEREIADVEAIRANGYEFLIIPSTMFWRLDRNPRLGRHLARNYRLITYLDGACMIYDLRDPSIDRTLFPVKKINVGQQGISRHHRSGWAYAIDSLSCLNDERGILLDTFVEKKFAWGSDPGDRYNGWKPYQQPWIGFLHNPPNVPTWFNMNGHAPADILQTECWRESMRRCRGLFTLSTYLKNWLAGQVPVPVCSLLHPTQLPEMRFNIHKYKANHEKKIVQVGWWLRKFHSIYRLPVTRLTKVLLDIGAPWIAAIHQKELELAHETGDLGAVQIVSYLPNNQYDELLSKNIVFLHLYDSSANNALIECIVRGTPVLVNPLEAVVEYLGPAYPFYFETLEEAAFKAENDSLVVAAHEYLKTSAVLKRLTGEHFRRSFIESEIYQSL